MEKQMDGKVHPENRIIFKRRIVVHQNQAKFFFTADEK